jgi:hypothetical protein
VANLVVNYHVVTLQLDNKIILITILLQAEITVTHRIKNQIKNRSSSFVKIMNTFKYALSFFLLVGQRVYYNSLLFCLHLSNQVNSEGEIVLRPYTS